MIDAMEAVAIFTYGLGCFFVGWSLRPLNERKRTAEAVAKARAEERAGAVPLEPKGWSMEPKTYTVQISGLAGADVFRIAKILGRSEQQCSAALSGLHRR